MVSVGMGHNHDAVAGRLRCNKEIRAESILVRSRYMCQGAVCRKRALKRVSSCASNKSWWHERMLAITCNVRDLVMVMVVVMMQAGQVTEVGSGLVRGDGAFAIPGDSNNIVV